MKTLSTFIETPILRGFQEIACIWELSQKYNSMICGGYARYCVSKHRDPIKAGDVDLFPQSEETSGQLVEALKSLGMKIKHENEISVTFEHLKEHDDIRWIVAPRVQVIKPKLEGSIVTVGTMDEILNNFDFTIVRAALISPTSGYVDSDFHEDDGKFRLVLKNIHCPISSTMRCIKYSKKGFWLPLIESVKLFNDWTERGGDYREKLVGAIDKMHKEDGSEPSQEEIDELEKLMNID